MMQKLASVQSRCSNLTHQTVDDSVNGITRQFSGKTVKQQEGKLLLLEDRVNTRSAIHQCTAISDYLLVGSARIR